MPPPTAENSRKVRLEPMTDEEFRTSREDAVSRHAQNNVERGLWTSGSALEASRSEFNERLPQGRTTPGRSFFHVVDERTGKRVGEVWTALEQTGGKTRFWVDWITVFPGHRRQGYATAVLDHLLSEASKSGADRVGLYVSADNTAAVQLYAKLGFETTNMRMVRPVTRAPEGRPAEP